jgi:DNA-directed RNA polymerase specialized sigma24 family protein
MQGLHEILTVLSSATATREERRHSERLLPDLLAWLGPRLGKRYPGTAQELIELAVEHVTDRVTTGTARYAGANGDRSAGAWCWRVANNRLISLWRHQQVLARNETDLAAQQQREAEEAATQGRRLAIARNVVTLAHDFVLEEGEGRKSAAERLQRMRLGIEVLFSPLTQEDQLGKYHYVRPGEEDADVLRKANDRLYQHRRRGRLDLSRVVARLVALDRLPEDEAIEFCAVARLPWPPPSPTRRRKRSGGLDA